MPYTPFVLKEKTLRTITAYCIKQQPLAPLAVSEVLVIPITKGKHSQLPETEIPRYLLVMHNVVLGQGSFGKVYKVIASVKFDPKSTILVKIRYPQLVMKVKSYEQGIISCDQDSEYLFGKKFLTMSYTPVGYGSAYYLPMECVQGVLFADLCRQTRNNPSYLSPKAKLQVALNAIRALKNIHAEELIHNDLKGNNLMVRPDFSVVIIDFGSATPVNCRKGYSRQREHYQLDPHHKFFTTQTDIYGLCHTLVFLFLLVPYVEFLNNFNLFLTLQGFSESEAYILDKLFRRAFSMNWVLRPDLETMEQTFQQLLDSRTENLSYPDLLTLNKAVRSETGFTEKAYHEKCGVDHNVDDSFLKEISSRLEKVDHQLGREVLARLFMIYSSFLEENKDLRSTGSAFSVMLTLTDSFDDLYRILLICYLTEEAIKKEPYSPAFAAYVGNEFKRIFRGELGIGDWHLILKVPHYINELYRLKNRYSTEAQVKYYINTVLNIITHRDFEGMCQYKTNQTQLVGQTSGLANAVGTPLQYHKNGLCIFTLQNSELKSIRFYHENLADRVPPDFMLDSIHSLKSCVNEIVSRFALYKKRQYEFDYTQILVPVVKHKAYKPAIFNPSAERQRYVALMFTATTSSYELKQLFLNPGEVRPLFEINHESSLMVLIKYIPVEAEFLDSSPVDFKRSSLFKIDGPIELLAFKKQEFPAVASPETLEQFIQEQMNSCSIEMQEKFAPFSYESLCQSIVKVYEGYQIHLETCDVFEQSFLHWLGINPLPDKTFIGSCNDRPNFFYMRFQGLHKLSVYDLAILINNKFSHSMAVVGSMNGKPSIYFDGKLFRELFMRPHFVNAVASLHASSPHYFIGDQGIRASASPVGFFSNQQGTEQPRTQSEAHNRIS